MTRIELDGDTWTILAEGATRDGKTYCHLASTHQLGILQCQPFEHKRFAVVHAAEPEMSGDIGSLDAVSQSMRDGVTVIAILRNQGLSPEALEAFERHHRRPR